MTRRAKPAPASEPEPPKLQQRVVRLEIDLDELRTLFEQLHAQQRKLTGAVYGMKGADARHPQRLASRQQQSLDDIPTGDKDALRRYAGLQPGKVSPINAPRE